MRTLAIALLLAAVATPQDRPTLIEPALARLAPDADVCALVRTRDGRIVTARGKAGAIRALDADRVELSRRCRVRTDLSAASTIAFRGSTSGETDTYTLAATAGQTVRVRVHPEGALDPLVTVGAASDDNSGPGLGADLTVTAGGPVSIAVSPVAGTGAYLLAITSSAPLATAALTGGDIGASLPHVAGTGAREARALEGVTGSGVLLGFVDTGIDPTHADVAGRVVGVWDQTLTPISGESSPAAGYGVHYKASDLGVSRSQDTDGHGTRVASIAGSVAPGAPLLMVKFNDSSAGIVDGVNFILAEAERLGFEAVVVNLSVGTHDGPHDGSSLLDQAITAATGRARHVVCAAGNESDPADGILHAQSTVTTPVSWTWLTTVTGSHAIDIWADGADRYTIDLSDGLTTLSTPSGSTGTAGPTASVTTLTCENRVDAPSNGATHIRIEFTNLFPLPWTITLTRTTSAGTGLVDGYDALETGSFIAGGAPLNADGSVPGIVVEPATSGGAIAVGAYRGRFMWDTASSTTVQADGTGANVAGNLALFSSRGPTRDGRMKPEIAAPGAYISGARSANAAPAAADIDADGVHTYGQGTSFSAPEVAGVLALLLHKNRLQTNDDLKALLASTALGDGFVAPGNAWGAGKVNAVGLLAAVIGQVDIEADAGHCSGSAPGSVSAAPLLLVVALLALMVRR